MATCADLVAPTSCVTPEAPDAWCDVSRPVAAACVEDSWFERAGHWALNIRGNVIELRVALVMV